MTVPNPYQAPPELGDEENNTRIFIVGMVKIWWKLFVVIFFVGLWMSGFLLFTTVGSGLFKECWGYFGFIEHEWVGFCGVVFGGTCYFAFCNCIFE